MVATIGSSQSEREKVNRGIGEQGSRDLICIFLSSQGHVTFLTVRQQPIRAHYSVTSSQTPGSDNATSSQTPGSDNATSSQTPGSDRTTGSDCATGSDFTTGSHSPSPSEVTARPEVKKCALLHNGIIRLYICVGYCTLRLVVMLWGDFNQRMRVE